MVVSQELPPVVGGKSLRLSQSPRIDGLDWNSLSDEVLLDRKLLQAIRDWAPETRCGSTCGRISGRREVVLILNKTASAARGHENGFASPTFWEL